MTGMNDEPMYPEAITGAAITSGAAEEDIIDAVRALMHGDKVDQQVYIGVTEAHTFVQAVGFNVLGRLDEAGVGDAVLIKEKLIALSEESEPAVADMFTVAQAYERERAVTPDPVEQRNLERLSSVSRAAGSITYAWAVCLVNPPGSPESAQLVEVAQGVVNDEDVKIEETTYHALDTLIEEMRTVHHLPPRD